DDTGKCQSRSAVAVRPVELQIAACTRRWRWLADHAVHVTRDRHPDGVMRGLRAIPQYRYVACVEQQPWMPHAAQVDILCSDKSPRHEYVASPQRERSERKNNHSPDNSGA